MGPERVNYFWCKWVPCIASSANGVNSPLQTTYGITDLQKIQKIAANSA